MIPFVVSWPFRGFVVCSVLFAAWLVMRPMAADASTLSFCPSVSRATVTVESLLEQRWKNVTRQGLDISCGSAALATILNHHFGMQVDEQALIRAILDEVTQEEFRKRGGFSMLDLKKVAMKFGYRVDAYRLPLEKLRQLGQPALVPMTIRGYKHFVVYRGMVDDHVVLADPSFGNTLMPDFTFQKMWQGVALVIMKQGDKRIPGRLRVRQQDVPQAEGGLRPLITQRVFQTSVGFDEF